MSLGREILFARLKKRILRKNEKHFLFFLKNAYFSSKSWKSSPKILIKEEVLGKNHIISERTEDGLSSHAIISISTFLTKIVFFGEGGWP